MLPQQILDSIKEDAKKFAEIPRNINCNEQGIYQAGIKDGYKKGAIEQLKKDFEFTVWAKDNATKTLRDEWTLISDNDHNQYTTAQLYLEYLKLKHHG